MASGMSATLKGLLGGASSKIFGSIIGRNSGSSKSDDAGADQEELWFTSLDDFKPICHMLHRGRFMTAYFACANKTGQHFLLKKYDKRKHLSGTPESAAAPQAGACVLHVWCACSLACSCDCCWANAAVCLAVGPSSAHLPIPTPDKMLPADERGVRRAIAFSELLQHPNLVRLMGTWESDDTIFVGE